ncbi:hypothetical protein XELAEV_18015581mg [Xenopus laevis]|uniref:Uncharacterized protein n=1 Tax=Xenopus laevis TaxID=8355 RepID=A0A974HW98_XENLA|nr:hypothetical protein XELAEV_18015581mg [Xenopus laevis]
MVVSGSQIRLRIRQLLVLVSKIGSVQDFTTASPWQSNTSCTALSPTPSSPQKHDEPNLKWHNEDNSQLLLSQ